jgi:hypothetical protein
VRRGLEVLALLFVASCATISEPYVRHGWSTPPLVIEGHVRPGVNGEIELAAAWEIPTTDLYAGMPPLRFQGDGKATVYTHTDDLRPICDPAGNVPRSGTLLACRLGNTIHLPNPCRYPNESFAVLMCHEYAHRAGWPRMHGP